MRRRDHYFIVPLNACLVGMVWRNDSNFCGVMFSTKLTFEKFKCSISTGTGHGTGRASLDVEGLGDIFIHFHV